MAHVYNLFPGNVVDKTTGRPLGKCRCGRWEDANKNLEACPNADAPPGPALKKVRKMRMQERVELHQYNGTLCDLATFITDPVPFKIVVHDLENVEKFPDIFERGSPEYDFSVDTFLKHSPIGDSEVTAVIQDSNWIRILKEMLTNVTGGFPMVYLKNRDISNTSPDTVMKFRHAHVLKHVACANLDEMMKADANFELTSNYPPLAYLTFPKNRNVIGVLSCPQCIQLKEISYDQPSQRYHERSLATFSLESENGRVSCIQAMFNVARYLVSVTGPLSAFHLVPNMPIVTHNGHFVVWEREGLRKTLNGSHHNEALLKTLYAAKLANVEWGVVEGSQTILITRIGRTLRAALLDGQITVEKAIMDVRAGVRQMHELGIAHTDLSEYNVCVDDGGAFLIDLEYITNIDTVRNEHVVRSDGQPRAVTARELDLEHLETDLVHMIHHPMGECMQASFRPFH